MSRELPFPIAFELPDGWTLVSPESCGQPDAAYVAVRQRNASDPVATNFVVSGFASRGDTIDVAAMANEYLTRLRSQYPVTLLKQDVITDEPSPETAQLVQIEYPAGQSTITLKQIHILNAFQDTRDPDTRAVLQLLLTCPADVFDQAGPEFSHFVATISPTQ